MPRVVRTWPRRIPRLVRANRANTGTGPNGSATIWFTTYPRPRGCAGRHSSRSREPLREKCGSPESVVPFCPSDQWSDASGTWNNSHRRRWPPVRKKGDQQWPRWRRLQLPFPAPRPSRWKQRPATGRLLLGDRLGHRYVTVGQPLSRLPRRNLRAMVPDELPSSEFSSIQRLAAGTSYGDRPGARLTALRGVGRRIDGDSAARAVKGEVGDPASARSLPASGLR